MAFYFFSFRYIKYIIHTILIQFCYSTINNICRDRVYRSVENRPVDFEGKRDKYVSPGIEPGYIVFSSHKKTMYIFK
jgi:hypothetical protein